MLVDCPDCGRSYRLDAADLGPRGRVVICPRCDARWFQRGAQDARIETASWSRVQTTDWSASPAAGGRRDMAGDAGRTPGRTASSTETFDPSALAAGRSAPSANGLRGLRVAAAALAATALVAGGIGARAAVVRVAPRTASFYAAVGWPVNLRGLRFVGIAPSRADGIGAAAADVSIGGEIRNVAQARIAVPRLVFEVRDAGGATLVRWSETPPVATLPAGRTLTFASRPQRMPPEGRSVLVRFEDPLPGDVVASAHQRLAQW